MTVSRPKGERVNVVTDLPHCFKHQTEGYGGKSTVDISRRGRRAGGV